MSEKTKKKDAIGDNLFSMSTLEFIFPKLKKDKKKKVTVDKSNVGKNPKEALSNIGKTLKEIVAKKNLAQSNKKLQDKNVEKASVSKTESKAKGKDAWKNYTTISQAKAAGSLFYSKNGKKMAAVLKEDLANIEGATAKEKLRNYLNKKLRNKKKMSTGGVLKQPDNPGLKKLPTAVRNKMGFMKKGGNVGHTDYRKAAKGMLLSSVDMMKKKKK
tara:strand:- start:315 stop:959 length:645 start_codon:yes stop_codon:yes gene_type:complete